MADRPIIFSASMVRALLDGSKTQTRRLLNPQPETFAVDDAGTQCEVGCLQVDGEPNNRVFTGNVLTAQQVRYAIGDRLYVRESGIEYRGMAGGSDLFRHDVPATNKTGHYWVRDRLDAGASYNVAGCSRKAALIGANRKVRPSIHMPRWASRLTLLASLVRVQRLQDISEDDARAEGVEMLADRSYRTGFAFLWNSLHSKPGTRWGDNPWIVAITFVVQRGNIDTLDRRAA